MSQDAPVNNQNKQLMRLKRTNPDIFLIKFIVDKMHEYQKKNNIHNECICNSVMFHKLVEKFCSNCDIVCGFIAYVGKNKQTDILLSNDDEKSETKIFAMTENKEKDESHIVLVHSWIILDGDTIIEPSLDVKQITNRQESKAAYFVSIQKLLSDKYLKDKIDEKTKHALIKQCTTLAKDVKSVTETQELSKHQYFQKLDAYVCKEINLYLRQHNKIDKLYILMQRALQDDYT